MLASHCRQTDTKDYATQSTNYLQNFFYGILSRKVYDSKPKRLPDLEHIDTTSPRKVVPDTLPIVTKNLFKRLLMSEQTAASSSQVVMHDDYWEVRNGQYSFRDVDISSFSGSNGISKNAITPLGRANNILNPYLSGSQIRQSSAFVLLERLRALSPSTAAHYDLKKTSMEQIQLRFLRRDLLESPPHHDFKSFIALSHCWLPAKSKSGISISTPRKKLKEIFSNLLGSSRETHQLHPFPVSPVMFKALLDESRSADEGIWVDQLCVAQEDEAEKAATIAALDVIYKSARLVIICLEDIEVNDTEEVKLRKYLPIYENSRTSNYLDAEVIELSQGLKRLLTSVAPSQRNFVMRMLRQQSLKTMAEIGHSEMQNLVENGLLSQARALEIHQSIMENAITENPGSFSQRVYELSRIATDYDRVLRPFAEKVWNSKWFTRAWCAHDAQMNERHIFLIKCQSGPRRVLRFTGSFLLHLQERFGSSLLSPDTHTRMNLHGFLFHLLQLRLKAQRPEISDASFQTWIQSSRTILALGGGGNPNIRDQRLKAQDALRDKICIILNTHNTGLCYKGPAITEDEFYRQLIILGLAARDPSALLTTGRFLPLTDGSKTCSWMQAPHILEAVAVKEKLLDTAHIPPFAAANLTLDSGQGSAWISLDLSFFTSEYISDFGSYANSLLGFDRDWRDLAIWFMKLSSDFGIRLMNIDPQPLKRKNTSNSKGDVQDPEWWISLETLVGCLFSGISWMASINVPYHQFPNLISSWEIIERSYTQREKSITVTESEIIAALKDVMSFLRALVMYGIPDTALLKDWSPYFMATFAGGHVKHRVISYGPRKRTRRGRRVNVAVAIPVCLSADEYKDFNRVWLLEQRDEPNEDGSRGWNLLGKVRMVGDVSGFCSDAERWETLVGQRVYGIG